jgi:hypothetical protein
MNKLVKCAECECTPSECQIDGDFKNSQRCVNCIKEDGCCCFAIHDVKENECCNDNQVGNCYLHRSGRDSSNIDIGKIKSLSDPQKSGNGLFLRTFFLHAKSLYAAALGIEILCIAAAEIGENTGLYLFGFNPWGIAIAYITGYSLAGFTTFVTILGRFGNSHSDEDSTNSSEIDSCCSVLEQDSSLGFVSNIKTTFKNFALGFKGLLRIRNQSGLKMIVKSSLFILVTAESACILTAETIDLIFYQYSILLSVPLALLAGAFTVVAPAAYRRAKSSNTNART